MASGDEDDHHHASLFKLPKRKRHLIDSSSSDTQGNRSMKYKKPQHDADSMSKWTTKTLDEYGIMYKNDPVTIEEFTKTIKSRAHEVCEKTEPDFLSTLIELSKRGLVFSLDVPEKETLKILDYKPSDSSYRVLQILREFDAFVNEVLKKEEEYLGSEIRNKT